MNLIRISSVLLSAAVLASCAPKVLKQMPLGGSIPYNEVVYVENNGRCSSGEIIKITGGNNSKNIPRKYDCTTRPK